MRPLGTWPLVACVPLVAACRINFDRNPAQDAASPPDAALPRLSCGVPPAFPVAIGSGSTGSANVDMSPLPFTAIASATAYYALLIDAASAVRGSAYRFEAEQLVAGAQNATLRSEPTRTISAVDTGDGVLAAAMYDQPSNGTALIPLDPQLAPRGAPYLSADWSPIDQHALARSSDGTIALAGHPTEQAVIERVSTLGVPLGSAHQAIAPSEQAQAMVFTPSGSGFVVAWQTGEVPGGIGSPGGLRARVLDAAFAESVPTTTLNPDQKGNGPGLAYAAGPDRYLFAWWFKEVNNTNDDLWISLRDGKLQELSRAQLSRTGTDPRIAAGDDGFLVVWSDVAAPSGLSAARVPFDDATKFTPRPVLSHGGSSLGWDVVSRAGQAALAWLESTDTPGTATLRFDPLCN